jgi:hypothetical protein
MCIFFSAFPLRNTDTTYLPLPTFLRVYFRIYLYISDCCKFGRSNPDQLLRLSQIIVIVGCAVLRKLSGTIHKQHIIPFIQAPFYNQPNQL